MFSDKDYVSLRDLNTEAAGDLFQEKLESLKLSHWTPEERVYVSANTNLRPIPWQIARKQWGRIEEMRQSQLAREAMLVASGRPDLALLSHQMFFMLDPDDDRVLWDPTVNRASSWISSVPLAIPGPEPSALEELVGWGKELVGAR